MNVMAAETVSAGVSTRPRSSLPDYRRARTSVASAERFTVEPIFMLASCNRIHIRSRIDVFLAEIVDVWRIHLGDAVNGVAHLRKILFLLAIDSR